jgi:type II secretory pathway component GspD/PulD (secretin)
MKVQLWLLCLNKILYLEAEKMQKHRFFIASVLCFFLAMLLNPDAIRAGNTEKARISRTAEGNSVQVQSSKSIEPNEYFVDVHLKDAGIQIIIQTIAKLTDKPVIFGGDILKLNISIDTSTKVTKSEAIRLIFNAIRHAGFQADEDIQFIFIRLPPLPEKPIPILPDTAALKKIEDQNQVVRMLFQLYNINSKEIVKLLQSFMNQQSYVTCDESTGTINVVDTVKNMIDIERVISMFDVPGLDYNQIFKLKYIDPNKAAKIINIIIAPGQSIILDFDKRKMLVVKTPAEIMRQIEVWLTKLDVQDADKMDYELVAVKYANVAEIPEIVNTIFSDMGNDKIIQSLYIYPLKASSQLLIFGRQEVRELVKKLIKEIDTPPVYSGNESLEKMKDPNQVLQYPFIIRHINVSDMEKLIVPLLQETDGSCKKNEGAETLFIIDTISNLVKLERVISAFDVEPSSSINQIFEIKAGDPNEIEELIKRLLSSDSQSKIPIRIETMFLTLSEESLEKVFAGLYLSLKSQIQLDEQQVESLLKIVKELKDVKIYEEPNICAIGRNPPESFIGVEIPIITSYREPNNSVQEAQPIYKKKKIGISLKFRRIVIIPNKEVNLRFNVQITQLTGATREMTFNDKYKWKIPVTLDYSKSKDTIVPTGKTSLIDCGTMTLYDKVLTNSPGEEKRVLLLVKATILSDDRTEK